MRDTDWLREYAAKFAQGNLPYDIRVGTERMLFSIACAISSRTFNKHPNSFDDVVTLARDHKGTASLLLLKANELRVAVKALSIADGYEIQSKFESSDRTTAIKSMAALLTRFADAADSLLAQ